MPHTYDEPDVPNKAVYEILVAVLGRAMDMALGKMIEAWQHEKVPEKVYLSNLKRLQLVVGKDLSRDYLRDIMPACIDGDINEWFREAVRHVLGTVERYHSYVSVGRYVDVVDEVLELIAESIKAYANFDTKIAGLTGKEKSDRFKIIADTTAAMLGGYGMTLLESYPVVERPSSFELRYGECLCKYCAFWRAIGFRVREDKEDTRGSSIEDLLRSMGAEVTNLGVNDDEDKLS